MRSGDKEPFIVGFISRLRQDPFGLMRRGFEKVLVGRLRYGRKGGYDAERYWKDRFTKYGSALRGAGHEGLSEEANAQLYTLAGDRLREFCQAEAIELTGARVVEIGCGPGYFTRFCRTSGVVAYTGVDITDILFPQLREEFPDFRFTKLDVTVDPIPGQFDVVLMIDVVEHIVEEERLSVAMDHIRKCLAPGGVFIVALPTAAADSGPKSLFYLRFWPASAIESRFPGYGRTARVAFRNGDLFALRDPRPGKPPPSQLT